VCDGFCDVDVLPSPKVQYHSEIGLLPALEPSLKLTDSGVQQLVGVALKSAVGPSLLSI
jgi:hypothetical protein